MTGGPAWSPDGRQIAFVRSTDEACRHLHGAFAGRAGAQADRHRAACSVRGTVLLGSRAVLVAGRRTGSSSPRRPQRERAHPASSGLSIDNAGEAATHLPTAKTRGREIFSPRSRPTGRSWPSCGRGPLWRSQDVWVQPLEGGEARAADIRRIRRTAIGLTWTPDGQRASSSQAVLAGEGSILKVSLAGGDPQPILGVGQNAASPSLGGNRMVYEQQTGSPPDIWRVPWPSRIAPANRAPEKLIASSAARRLYPAYSPDGRRIAFVSLRRRRQQQHLGLRQRWLQPGPVDELRESRWITPLVPGRPHSSSSAPLEAGDLEPLRHRCRWRVPRRLTQEPSRRLHWDLVSRRSVDLLPVGSERPLGQIWKIPSEGGEAAQVTRNGRCGYPAVSSGWPAISTTRKWTRLRRLASTGGRWRGS